MEVQTFLGISFMLSHCVLGNPENLSGSSGSKTRQAETTFNILTQTPSTTEDMEWNDQHTNDYTYNFSTDQPTSSSSTSQEFSTTESDYPEMEPYYNSRVYKGKDVNPPNKYPWVVKVLAWKDNSHFSCTGSIIDSLHILTAAHCVVFGTACSPAIADPRDVQVIVGNEAARTENKNKSNPELKTNYKILDLFVHEGYNASETQWGNDIAILRLAEPLDLQSREDVSAVCLPSTSPKYGDGIVVGWGALGPEYEMPTKLQEGTVRVNDICFPYFPFYFDEPDSRVVCLYGITQQSFVCKGDSGGPVMQLRNNSLEIVGILSAIHDIKGMKVVCASKLSYAIATNVYYYKDWISQKVPYHSCQ